MFGMGTGGPSSQSTPTDSHAASGDVAIIAPFKKMSRTILQKNKKVLYPDQGENLKNILKITK